MSSGTTCAVLRYHNNSRKLKVFSKTSRVEHQQLHQTCPCPARHAEEGGTETSVALGFETKISLEESVCSFHFVDKKPTELHPDPELYLGYD